MADESNYTETTEDHRKEGYTARIRTNNIAPKTGSGPLEVVEFSLIDEYKNKLEQKLAAWLSANPPKSEMSYEGLGAIIAETLPKPILDEIQEFGHTPGMKTVYVIHNLPEIELTKRSNANYRKHYADYIQIGIAQAAGLELQSSFWFSRHDKEHSAIAGGCLHKHESAVDMLGGVSSDGAETRFTDMQTLLESPDSDLKDPSATFTVTSNMDSGIKLKDFADHYPKWRDSVETKLWLDEGATAEAHAQYENALRSHSQNVLIDKGSLAIWANDGELFHQALPTTRENNNYKTHPRIVMGNEFDRSR